MFTRHRFLLAVTLLWLGALGGCRSVLNLAPLQEPRGGYRAGGLAGPAERRPGFRGCRHVCRSARVCAGVGGVRDAGGPDDPAAGADRYGALPAGTLKLEVSYDAGHLRVVALLHGPGGEGERRFIRQFYRDFQQAHAGSYGGDIAEITADNEASVLPQGGGGGHGGSRGGSGGVPVEAVTERGRDQPSAYGGTQGRGAMRRRESGGCAAEWTNGARGSPSTPEHPFAVPLDGRTETVYPGTSVFECCSTVEQSRPPVPALPHPLRNIRLEGGSMVETSLAEDDHVGCHSGAFSRQPERSPYNLGGIALTIAMVSRLTVQTRARRVMTRSL